MTVCTTTSTNCLGETFPFPLKPSAGINLTRASKGSPKRKSPKDLMGILGTCVGRELEDGPADAEGS
jgi:hypothetical protein